MLDLSRIPASIRTAQLVPLPRDCGKHELLRGYQCAEMHEEDRLLAWAQRHAAADTCETVARVGWRK
jgi:hypothetical protein